MPSFHYHWNNTAALTNLNAVNQRVSYRRKSTGGSFITTGFTPTNPMAVSVTDADSPSSLLSNVIYELQQETLCTTGGPIPNTSGTKEFLKFACITPTNMTLSEPEGGIGIVVQGLDISATRFTLKKTSNNTVLYTQKVSTTQNGSGVNVCLVQVPSGVQATYISGEQYYWSYELFATVGGVEVGSVATIGLCTQPSWTYTPSIQDCPAVFNIGHSYPNITWAIDNISANSNVTGQKFYWRLRSVGGIYLENGFTPSNTFAKTVQTVVFNTSTVPYNKVAQYRQETLCNTGGPTQGTSSVSWSATNGNIREFIRFQCIEPTITSSLLNNMSIIAVSFVAADTDITKARFVIKDSSGNNVLYNQVATKDSSTGRVGVITGAIFQPDTDYRIEVSLFAMVEGVEVDSSSSVYLNQPCGVYTVRTNTLKPSFAGTTSNGALPSLSLILDSPSATSTEEKVVADFTFITTPSWVFVAEPDDNPLRAVWYQNDLSTDTIETEDPTNPEFKTWYLQGLVVDEDNDITYRVYAVAYQYLYTDNALELRTV